MSVVYVVKGTKKMGQPLFGKAFDILK